MVDGQLWTMHGSTTHHGALMRWFTAIAVATLGFALVGSPVGAQEGEPEPEQVPVTKEAYWTNPALQAVPDILVEEFPPGVVCIVFPEFCGDDARQITGPIDENRPKKDDAPKEPVQPVNPNSYPASRMGGTPRYASALAFEMPRVPEGQEIARFELLLHETQPTFSLRSPAFRQAVLAVFASIQQGELATEEFLKILEDPERYPAVDRTLLDLEACPVVESFEEGDNQDWEQRPETDCIFGATGERDDDGVWHFDLTFAAQSWSDGSLANEGVYIGPLAADNLAFGDPDTSDNAQVSLSAAESPNPPQVVVEYMPAAGGGDEFTLSPGGDTGGATTGGDDFGGGFDGSGSSDGFSSPSFESQVGGEADTAMAPEIASGPEADVGGAPGGEQPTIAADRSGPVTPWSVWLLLPAMLGGLYVLSRSLTAEPEPVVAREGAMTRLIQERNGVSAPATQV